VDVFIALGVFGQQMMVDRANKLVMVRTSSQPDAVDFATITLNVQAFKEFQETFSPLQITYNNISQQRSRH